MTTYPNPRKETNWTRTTLDGGDHSRSSSPTSPRSTDTTTRMISDDETNQRSTIAEASQKTMLLRISKRKRSTCTGLKPSRTIDLTFPGWGSGAGRARSPQNGRGRHIIKAPLTEKRRDERNKGNLINTDKTIRLGHKVGKVHSRFNSAMDSWASIRAPIGNTSLCQGLRS